MWTASMPPFVSSYFTLYIIWSQSLRTTIHVERRFELAPPQGELVFLSAEWRQLDNITLIFHLVPLSIFK